MKVKSESEVAQSCPTLSDPMNCSLPGFCVHGIFQARVLEWGATAFSVLFYNQKQFKFLLESFLILYAYQCVCVHLNVVVSVKLTDLDI